MCAKPKGGCRRPDDLKGKPTECTPEQIRKCHGDVDPKKHPCVQKDNK
ncbi:hypothetical protein HQ560_03455 [bacterium]|nr:hypothetical protein [bacterium]